MKAICFGKVVAQSDDTIVIEGNHYFPPNSIKKEYFILSKTTSICPWKGEAHYYNLVIDGKTDKDAAWYYPKPKDGSTDIVGKDFTNYVAFWHGVKIEQ